MDLSLPAQTSGPERIDPDNLLKLEVVLRPDALEVGDRIGGLISASVHARATTSPRCPLLQSIRPNCPATRGASVLAQPTTV